MSNDQTPKRGIRIAIDVSWVSCELLDMNISGARKCAIFSEGSETSDVLLRSDWGSNNNRTRDLLI